MRTGLRRQIWESEFRNAMLGMLRAGIIGHAAAVSAHKFAAETVQVFAPSTGAVLRIAETCTISPPMMRNLRRSPNGWKFPVCLSMTTY